MTVAETRGSALGSFAEIGSQARPATRGFSNSRVAVVVIAIAFAALSTPKVLLTGHLLPALVPLVLVCLHLTTRRSEHSRPILLPVTILMFVAWFCATTLWSDDAASSALDSMMLLLLAASAILIGSQVTLRNLIAGLIVGGAFVLALSLAVAVVSPSEGLMAGDYQAGALRGIYAHRNHLALVLLPPLIASLAFDFRVRHPVLMKIVLTGVFLGGLLATRSNTSLLAALFAIALTLLLLAVRSAKPGYRIVPAVGSAVVIGVGAQVALANLEGTFSLIDRDTTLTGRTDIWKFVEVLIAQRPVLGWGWGGTWSPGTAVRNYVEAGVQFDVPEAHNGFLDAWLQVGAIGLALLMLLFAIAIVKGLRVFFRTESTLTVWLPVYTCAVLLSNITETIGTLPPVLFVIMTGIVITGRVLSESRRPAADVATGG